MGKKSGAAPKPNPTNQGQAFSGARPMTPPPRPGITAQRPTFDPFKFRAAPQYSQFDKKVQGYGQNFNPASQGPQMGNPYAQQAQVMQDVGNRQAFGQAKDQWGQQRAAALRSYNTNKQTQMNRYNQQVAAQRKAQQAWDNKWTAAGQKRTMDAWQKSKPTMPKVTGSGRQRWVNQAKAKQQYQKDLAAWNKKKPNLPQLQQQAQSKGFNERPQNAPKPHPLTRGR